MVAVLLLSHGNYAQSLKDTTKIFFPDMKEVTAMGLDESLGVEDFRKQLKSYLAKKHAELVIMVDILGGTPFNVALELGLDNEKCHIVTGLSMPMLFAALNCKLSNKEVDIDNLLNDLKYQSQAAIQIYDQKHNI